MAMVYRRFYGLDVRIARIFNVFGPTMGLKDGRMIPAFIQAALNDDPLPVHGDGQQTRSMCYVDDMIDGLIALGEVGEDRLPVNPIVNLGNPNEITVLEAAKKCWATVRDSEPKIAFTHPNPDDPKRRFRRPCLYYYLRACSAPCAGLVSKEEYRENVRAQI